MVLKAYSEVKGVATTECRTGCGGIEIPARDMWYQSGFERPNLGEGSMAKTDGEARSKETQVMMEARSRKVDETVVDKGDRLKDRSSMVAFHEPLEDEELEDIRGSLDSIMERFRGAFRMILACRYCHQDDHISSKCPKKPIPLCWYCKEGRHRVNDCPVLMEARERTRRAFEEWDSDSEEEIDDEMDDEGTLGRTMNEDDPIGGDTPQGQVEGIVDDTLADEAELDEDLKDSKGGERMEIKGGESEEVDGFVNMLVREESQSSSQMEGKLDARSIGVVRDGITLEDLGVRLPRRRVNHGTENQRAWNGGTQGRDYGSTDEDKNSAVTGPTKKKSTWMKHAFIALGRGPKERRRMSTREHVPQQRGRCWIGWGRMSRADILASTWRANPM